MTKLRKYGSPPFDVAVVHGGPGAAGEMKPVAKLLEHKWGVLEPFQTEDSIDGQLIELKNILEENGDPPYGLIGFSWGAWLSFIFAAKYPFLVKKLILISSGPFEEEYAKDIMPVRLKRLTMEDRKGIENFISNFSDRNKESTSLDLERFGFLLSKADSYHPKTNELAPSSDFEIDMDIFRSVWNEASAMREAGALLKFGHKIKCPVVAVHGKFDPHPAKGVELPLKNIVKNFKFLSIDRCGHRPWSEQFAHEDFRQIIINELSQQD